MSETAPAWVSVLPDADYQHSFGLKAGRAEAFFAPTERHADLLAQRRHWLRNDTAHCAALLPGAEPLLEEAIALARQWNSIPSSFDLGDATSNTALADVLPLPAGKVARFQVPLRPACGQRAFSLTPALSRWERENVSQRCVGSGIAQVEGAWN